ncbi:glycosylhydrolase-like jelly roll fold domain-containing protein, partial [Planctomycetota bacterium]
TWIDASDFTKVDRGDPYPNYGLTPEDELQPWIDHAPLMGTLLDEDRLLAWQNGIYTLSRDYQEEISVNVKGTRVIPLNDAWHLSFPSGWDAPQHLDLPELKPWSALEDPGTRVFSGTAAYSRSFVLEMLNSSNRLLLDLGRVSHIAEITVNSKVVTTLWAPPFRADITPYVQADTNQLTVKVTNTWYNRLIHDAGLSEPERKTWTISGPKADAQPEVAGLIGPVRLYIGKVATLE